MYALKESMGVWVVSIAIVDGLLGYFFAYLFYFLFAMHDDVIWMCRGLIVIFLYVCGTAFLTFEALSDPDSHVEFSEGLVNGLKAFANLIVMPAPLHTSIVSHPAAARSTLRKPFDQ